MTDHPPGRSPELPPSPRRAGHVLSVVGRALLITAAVVLAVGGLAFVGVVAMLIVGLNSWASNK